MQRILILFIAVAFCANGCAWIKVRPPHVAMEIAVSSHLNPDEDGRSSPVVLKVYELTTEIAFKGKDFFELFGNAKDALSHSLVQVKKIELSPKNQQQLDIKLGAEATHLGFIVAFRDLDNSNWRRTISVKQLKTHYKKVKGKYRMYLRLSGNNIAFTPKQPQYKKPPPNGIQQ